MTTQQEIVSEEDLRYAAQRIVDKIHDVGTHLILLSGNSAKPAFSLIAAAWKKRYPEKQIPKHLPLKLAKREHIIGKNVVVFEEVVVSGTGLRHAREKVAIARPKLLRTVALLCPHFRPMRGVTIGTRGGYTRSQLGLDYRNELAATARNKKDHAKKMVQRIRKKRSYLRRVAEGIKPRFDNSPHS